MQREFLGTAESALVRAAGPEVLVGKVIRVAGRSEPGVVVRAVPKLGGSTKHAVAFEGARGAVETLQLAKGVGGKGAKFYVAAE